MLERADAIAQANAHTFHAALNEQEENVAELNRLIDERAQRLEKEEIARQEAAGETAKEVQKQAWLAARLEWNKEILHKQRLKRRHRIREETLAMKNKFNARWIVRRAELVGLAKKEVRGREGVDGVYGVDDHTSYFRST